jgi:hypothetical protein
VVLDTANPFDRTSKTKIELMEFDIRNYLQEAADKSAVNIYQLYTKPGDQLVIDAQGEAWDAITGDMIMTAADNDISAVMAFEEGKEYNTRDIAEWAKEEGYDSVRINHLWDHGGFGSELAGYGSIGIFFNPNDVKSADTVTYDGNGNVIPPSERFNAEEPDIRYSFSDSEIRKDNENPDSTADLIMNSKGEVLAQ